MNQKLWLVLFCRRYILFLFINIGIIIGYNLCQCYFKEDKNSLFVIVCVLAKFQKNIIPIVPITVITSIPLKLHRLSIIPDQFRIGSQSRKCSKMIERKQRVKQLRRLGIKSTQKNPRGKLIDISSILKGESTLKFPRRINVISSTWIRLSKSMKSRRIFHVEVRCRINGESTKMCPLGFDKSKTLSDIKHPCNLPDLTVVLLLLKLVLFSATPILLASLPPAISTIDRTIDRLIYSKNPDESLDDCKRVQTSVDKSQKNVDKRRRVTRRVYSSVDESLDKCRRVQTGDKWYHFVVFVIMQQSVTSVCEFSIFQFYL